MVQARETDIENLCERIASQFDRGGGELVAAVYREAVEFDPDAAADALVAAGLLAELRLDPPAIAAALVVHRLADETTTLDEISEQHGADVRMLADGVHRLRQMRWDRDEVARERAQLHGHGLGLEATRKMFLAMAADVRVVIIALALRVRDMRSLRARDATEESRRRAARETLEIFAPLANRLGIFLLKWELEDLSLRELEPDIYRSIGKQLARKRAERTADIEQAIAELETAIEAAGIDGTITGRPKHIYSIYRKMQRKQVGFEEIYDVSAVRIMVQRVADCYAALGLVHSKWTPIPGEFDDYIARPKGNGYQSLHTAVVGPGGHSLEVQIRTEEMHRLGEYGVAAHWRYKEGGSRKSSAIDERFNFLRQLMDWQKEVTDPHEFVDSLKTDIFQDQVYVFTPRGDVIDLPQGATPVDFAYRIHTNVGHRTRGALIAGQIVPLDHKLKTGDRVEILTHKRPQPSRDWLSPQLGYVRTTSARQKIRQWFRQQGRDEAIVQGRDLLDRELKRAGIERARFDELAPGATGYERLDDLLAAVGFGLVTTHTIAARVLDADAASRPPEPAPVTAAPKTRSRKQSKPKKSAARGVSASGIGDILSQPARCCTPVPGDPVIGYISRGKGIIIHRRDCPNILSHREPERLLDIEWGLEGRETYPVTIAVDVMDRPGALRDISTAVSDFGVNMQSIVFTDRKDGTATIELVLDVRNNEQVVRLLGRFERIRSVVRARRRSG